MYLIEKGKNANTCGKNMHRDARFIFSGRWHHFIIETENTVCSIKCQYDRRRTQADEYNASLFWYASMLDATGITLQSMELCLKIWAWHHFLRK